MDLIEILGEPEFLVKLNNFFFIIIVFNSTQINPSSELTGYRIDLYGQYSLYNHGYILVSSAEYFFFPSVSISSSSLVKTHISHSIMHSTISYSDSISRIVFQT